MLRRNPHIAIAVAGVALLSAVVNKNAPAQFLPGSFVTYDQFRWGDDPGSDPAAALLLSNFGIVYPFSVVEVGISGLTGFSMIFTSANASLNYLPQGGTPGPLIADLLDPTLSSSGMFGGAVLALQLNVDFSDAGVLSGSAGVPFGNLILQNLGANQSVFNGLSVRQYLDQINTSLGGGNLPPGTTYDDLYGLTDELINHAFTDGTPSLFAQGHLRIAGDFNGDGKINAADYVKWRKNNGPATEYTEWRTHFGNPAGSGSGGLLGTSVPEPTALLWLATAVCWISTRRRK